MATINLDTKDKRILQIMELNARIALTQLAKEVKLSKQVVKYRIEKLEKQEIIQGYNAVINLENLGKSIHIIYLKLMKLTTKKENEWIERINKNPNIMTVGKNQGTYDLTIALNSQNNQELDNILNKIFENHNQYIKEKIITTAIHFTNNTLNLLNTNEERLSIKINKQELVKIDEKDLIIIKELSQNARMSLVDLSVKLEMTANGVKNKIKNLEKNNIISHYKTKINYEKLKFLHFRVLLKLENYSKDVYQKFEKYLISENNVESVGHYYGFADIDFRCYAKSMEEFNIFISKLKDEFIEDIIEVNSMLIYDWKKINYY
jgi:Lrp/AsnC family leucine-responsive transcriptional regulator